MMARPGVLEASSLKFLWGTMTGACCVIAELRHDGRCGRVSGRRQSRGSTLVAVLLVFAVIDLLIGLLLAVVPCALWRVRQVGAGQRRDARRSGPVWVRRMDGLHRSESGPLPRPGLPRPGLPLAGLTLAGRQEDPFGRERPRGRPMAAPESRGSGRRLPVGPSTRIPFARFLR